jgi:hypothetical protein
VVLTVLMDFLELWDHLVPQGLLELPDQQDPVELLDRTGIQVTKAPQEPLVSWVSQDPPDLRDSPGLKDKLDRQDLLDSLVLSEQLDPLEPQESKEPKEIKDSTGPQDPQDPQDHKDPLDLEELQDPQDPQEELVLKGRWV